MLNSSFINDLILVGIIGLACVLILGQLKLPVIAGLIFAGALMGPHGLSLVANSDQIHLLSKVGVVMLLFSIGLEFSPKRIAKAGRLMAMGGFLQVGITTGAVVLGLRLWGYNWSPALVFGFVIALSSTAIVMRLLQERGELQAPHGKIIVGTLLFQDIAVVPMMLTLPVLAGQSDSQGIAAFFGIMLKAFGLVTAALIASKWILPWIFDRVKAMQGSDLFLLAVILVLASVGWLTAKAGLGVALGAFIAGMALAGTNHGKQAAEQVRPFKDLFLSIFFISLGMLFNFSLAMERPLQVGTLVAVFVLGKGIVAMMVARAMAFPWKVALLTGAGLAQFGEFGYILLESGKYYGLVNDREMGVLLAAGCISMFFAPLAARLTPRFLAGESILLPLEKLLALRGIDRPAVKRAHFKGHVVILGYGDVGRILMEKLSGQPFQVMCLESSSAKVDESRERGHHVFYGDFFSREALEHAHLKNAAAVVLTPRNSEAMQRAVSKIRSINRSLPLFIYNTGSHNLSRFHGLGSHLAVLNDLETLYLKVKRQGLFGAKK